MNINGWTRIAQGFPSPQKRVLVAYTDHHGRLQVTMGWYAPPRTVESSYFEGEVNDEYDEASDTYYLKEQWADESQEGEYHYPISGVTHWMPLPDMPEVGDMAKESIE